MISKSNSVESSEEMHQRGFITWFRQKFPGVLIFYINNGAHHVATGKRLKQMGAVPGVPDLYIPEWSIWIEMKRKDGGIVSPEQIRMHAYLTKIGHTVIIGHGATHASTQVLNIINTNSSNMSAPQVSLNITRRQQICTIRTKRSDCAKLSDDDIVKMLFYEKLDEEIFKV